MKVSVIVPVYNEEKYIKNCLKAIFKQTEKPDEVIVVDNNCTDRTIEIAGKFPVKIIKEKQQGMIPARNKGFNSAQFGLILRTDADTHVPIDWIKKIKPYFNDKKLVALSGPNRFYGLPGKLHLPIWPTKVYSKYLKQVCQHDCLIGPNMAIRKSTWIKIKNEVCLNDKQVHEDIDLSLHIARHGQIKFIHDITVNSSFRRWKKLKPYIDYPLRNINTIRRHKELIIATHSKMLVKKIMPKTKRIINALTSQASSL